MEGAADDGAWPRAAGFARAVVAKPPKVGHVEQAFGGSTAPAHLRFFGTHLFDLLDKLANEVDTTDARRRVICAALEAAARSGAPVVRLWGSLKRTGDNAEVARAADVLELVLDENARRERPLRFVIALLNHQPGYGSPRPEASLDDQDPASPWSARRLYLERGWRASGQGLLASRIEAFRARPEIAGSKEILGWELVNELDTQRLIAGGSLAGAAAATLRDTFLVPALDLLAGSFSQPILLGDLRGAPGSYVAFARTLIAALPARARDRLVWTSHVYAPRAAASAPELARATAKLDLDLALAAEHGLPFLLGEIGQLVPGAAHRFCADGPPHDLPQLFAAVLDPKPTAPRRAAIEAALFWGEGRCGLDVPGDPARRITLGAGGDSADLSPSDAPAHAALRAIRRSTRFRTGAGLDAQSEAPPRPSAAAPP